MILTQIKQNQLNARKSKDKFTSGILTALMSEVAIVGKNNGNRETTDEEAIKVIKKFVKNLNETIKLTKDEAKLVEFNSELEIYESFLPKMMSERETEMAVENIVRALPEKNPKLMGQIMGQLSKEYGEMLDKGIASRLVKAALI